MSEDYKNLVSEPQACFSVLPKTTSIEAPPPFTGIELMRNAITSTSFRLAPVLKREPERYTSTVITYIGEPLPLIDIERMQNAITSPTFHVLPGLTREQKREHIIAVADLAYPVNKSLRPQNEC